MKKYVHPSKCIYTLFLITTFLMSCDDEKKGELNLPTALLSRTWVAGSITLDNVDITEFGYSSIRITFDIDGTWTCSGGNGLFGTSGTWSFKTDADGNPDYNTLVMSGIEMSILLNVQASFVQLTFEYDASTPIDGRVASTSGTYSVFLVPAFQPSL